MLLPPTKLYQKLIAGKYETILADTPVSKAADFIIVPGVPFDEAPNLNEDIKLALHSIKIVDLLQKTVFQFRVRIAL